MSGCRSGVIKQINYPNILVEVQTYSACAECHAKMYCTSTETENKIFQIYAPEIIKENQYKIGEQVSLEINTKMGLIATLWAYVIPFFILVGSLLIAQQILNNDIISAFVALASILVYYLALYILRKKFDSRFRITIKKS